MRLFVSVAFNGLALLRFGGLESEQRGDGSGCSRLCSSLWLCERLRTLSLRKVELGGYRLDGMGCVDQTTIIPSNKRMIESSQQ